MNWPLVKLEHIFDIARGGSPRPIQDFITDDPNGINWIMIGDASESSKYIEKTKKKIKKEGSTKSRLVHPGDFLLTNSMSFGRPYIMRTSGCIHDGWLVLSPKSENIYTDYFYHLLGSNFVYYHFSRVAAGAVVKNLNIDLVKSLEIPLPPLIEQKRIASILDKADAIRRKRQQAIQLTDEFLRAVFLDMFGDPVTNPMGWKENLLSELCLEKMNNGIFKKNEEYGDGLPVVWVSELFGSHQITFSEKTNRVAATEKDLNKYGIYYGDILFCRSSLKLEGIGWNNVYLGEDNNALFECHLIRMRPKQECINPIFLNFQLRQPGIRLRVFAQAKTVTMTTIDQDGIGKVKVIVPEKALQDRFECIYIKTMKYIKKLKANKDIDILFKSLSQKAFASELWITDLKEKITC